MRRETATHMMPSKKTRLWRNWSGSVRCEPNHRASPISIEEVQSEVLRCTEEGERLRVVGAGHAFSPLCHSDENQMSLEHFQGVESTDLERRRVWVGAGTPLRDLGEALQERGLALATLADLDAHTIGGAISVGVHGSGLGVGNLSTQVTALKLVCAGGRVRSISREDNAELFDAARLSLGALGVITDVELQCVDAYRLYSHGQRAPLEETLLRLDEYLHGTRNFEFRWFPYSDTVQLQFMNGTQRPAGPLQSVRRVRELAVENSALWVLSQLARRLPALSEPISRAAAHRASAGDAVLDWNRAYATRRRLRSDYTEYSIPLERLPRVLRQIDRLISALKFHVHFPLEVRFVPGDALWLSPAYQRDSACIAVHVARGTPYENYFAAVTEIFDRNEGRPHWGSLHDKTAHELRGLYPRFEDFRALRHELDPRGVFLNGHLAALFDVDRR
jgi:FAD-linked oxidoreductase